MYTQPKLHTKDIMSFLTYRKYTQSNCVFECQLKNASDKCQCIPWDYPQLTAMPICDRFGRECFTSVMTTVGPKCECPIDCETTR